MLIDFDRQLESSKSEVSKRREEFMRITVLPPEFRVPAPTPNSPQSLLLDLSKSIGRIRDQGNQGTTVGFSVAYSLQAAIKGKYSQTVELSPRGIFTLAKKYDEWPGEKYEGTSVKGALEAAQKVGVYLESQWPYSDQNTLDKLKPTYIITGYRFLDTNTASIVKALQEGHIPIATITVTSDFDNPPLDGRIVVRTPLRELGGHSIAIVGYDQSKAEFKFANMWGENWGLGGFALIRDIDLKKILQGSYVVEDVSAYQEVVP